MAADLRSSPPNPAATMSVGEDQCNSEPTSDNDKLITVVEMGFRELTRKQEEQTKSQQEQSEKLRKAVEALKMQAPTPDKKTAFWNLYMKLADEHDKEFQRKYSTDLDTALIFAGLFSAVSSAFIIQIQPQLIPDARPSKIVVVVQSLLYVSLSTTPLAALLAVLVKQWIMHYEAAGSRGTIEQRGLERQRKLDGLHKWKFDTVLQMFPLLLQFALLLFATTLSVYLGTVHHTIAIIVQILTSFGFIAYISLLMMYQEELIVQLFKALQVAPIDTALIAKIINTTAQLANDLVGSKPNVWSAGDILIATEASRFCTFFLRSGGSLDVLVSAAMLARFESLERLLVAGGHSNLETQEIEWVYVALTHVQQLWEEKLANAEHPEEWDTSTTFAVDSLLHLLAFGAGVHLMRPPLPAVHMILQALSISGDISISAFLVLCKAESWFVDPTLKPNMQQSEVWSHLGQIALRFQYGRIVDFYIKMGRNLVNTDSGKSLISQDLSAWINVFVGGREWGGNYNARENFSSVIRAVWVPELNKQHNFSDEMEESRTLALSALSKVWDSFKYPNLHELIRLARCTVTTSLRVQYEHPWLDKERNISLGCRKIFSSQLGKVLVEAAAHTRKAGTEDDPRVSLSISSSGAQETQTLERAAKILEALGQKIGTEFDPGSGEVKLGGSKKHYRDWAELEKHFMMELDDLEALFSET
ncbi:hypothetical protein DFH09DRAFT_1470940 [Mycena vulgaris]|nr:hypothetical protein DFH09DRAFT_1470940 [Mycena vulgaris]